MPKMPQMDLKQRQVKPQVREEKDGALEDIIRDTVTWCMLEVSHWDTSSILHVWRTCCWNSTFISLYSSFLWLRFKRLTIQMDRWSTASSEPGDLSHFWTPCKCNWNHTQAYRQKSMLQNVLYIKYKNIIIVIIVKYIKIYKKPHAMLCCQHFSVNFLCKYEVGIICHF